MDMDNDALMNELENINIDKNNRLTISPKTIPKQTAKRKRDQNQKPKEPQITYDDILNKMGMYVVNGQLVKTIGATINNKNNNVNNDDNKDNDSISGSYIYNKYFSHEQRHDGHNVRKPRNITEYKNMLIHDIMQRRRLKQVKSTKIILPTSNVYYPSYSGDMNKLFKLIK